MFTHRKSEGADYRYGLAPVSYTHLQHDDKQWFINCGSLGCPAQEHNIARAGLLHLSESSVSFAPVQISYDADQVVSLIRSLRYPDHKNILKYFYGIQ